VARPIHEGDSGRRHPSIVAVEVVGIEKEADPAASLVSDPGMLGAGIGTGEEQRRAAAAGRRDHDPALVLLDDRIFEQVEAECLDVEGDGLVVFTDDEADETDIGHGSMMDRAGASRARGPWSGVRADLTRVGAAAPVGYARREMVGPDAALMTLVRAIVANDAAISSRLLAASPVLASTRAEGGATRQAAKEYYLSEIEHYLYAGDTALHVAAAGYRPEIIRLLLSRGADVGARNRRGARPLHYAVDGIPGSRNWNPRAQAESVTCLIEAGADPNAGDKSGVTPLHRAVRTRCAAAVKALLDGGADPQRKNRNGSTPMQLATWTTGRGGSGSPEAKAQQDEIVHLLERRGHTR
jgi:hypothetical protein